jgi:diaminopimelate decarboxylase
MNTFEYRDGELFVEDLPVREIAEQHGTPLYLYSRNHMRTQYRNLTEAMAEVSPLICYSVKANSNASVIKTFIDEGSGFDIVSGGELYRALRAGADSSKIVFAGVGKTCEEIEYALKEDILFFTVESEPEAERISECATRLGVTGRIAFRINPDVDPKTHKYISTGKKENKFGLDIDRTLTAYEMASSLPNIEIAGIHMHIGSQLLDAQPFADALEKVRELCGQLKSLYPTFQYIDIGGGIGIQYQPDQEPLDPTRYAELVIPLIKEMGLSLVMEPGRNLVGNSALLVCRVQYIKDNPLKTFIVVDAGMNDLIRPSLYEAYHEILSVRETTETIYGDVVGPICESTDFLAIDRDLPAVEAGDLIAAGSVGAYGFTMASTYNSRPRPAEVMVDKDQAFVIRDRETFEDLVRHEISK